MSYLKDKFSIKKGFTISNSATKDLTIGFSFLKNLSAIMTPETAITKIEAINDKGVRSNNGYPIFIIVKAKSAIGRPLADKPEYPNKYLP